MEEVQATMQSGNTLFGLLDQIVGKLNDHAKETAILSAYMIAAADGNIDDSEMEQILQIGERLGMSRAHLTGVITTAQQSNTPELA